MSNNYTYEQIPEINYDISNLLTDSVIRSRTETKLFSPAPIHSYTSNPTIRFSISGDQFLDMGSIELWADVTYATTVGNAFVEDTLYVAATAAKKLKAQVPSSGQLFQSMRIMTSGGVIIENITDVNLLFTLLQDATAPKAYQDTVLSATANHNTNPSIGRRGCSTAQTLRLACTDLSGFLHSRKYIHPNSLGGGLVIELEMADPKTLFVGRNNASLFTAELSKVNCRYETVTLADSFVQEYRDQIFPNGFSMFFSTWQNLISLVSGTENQIVLLNKVANRVKSAISIVRNQANINSSQTSSFARYSAGFNNYQFSIGGVQHPPSPIDSYAKSYQTMLKLGYNSKSVECGLLDYNEFSLDNTVSPTDSMADLNYGNFLMSYDFEKNSGTSLSGLGMAGISDSISFDFGAKDQGTYVVNTFLHFERSINIGAGGVFVRD
jgi:hypothetical protein